MTRSDLVLAVNRASGNYSSMTDEEKTVLIIKMYHKIENAYQVVFELENDKHFAPVGEVLRKCLEE